MKMPEYLNNGPVEDRSCRDILCCLIFIAFLGGCVVVAALGFSKGNPDLVLYPYDEEGNQCGLGNMTDYPYIYLYNAVSNLKTYNLTGIAQGVCVTNCPVNYTGSIAPCKSTTNNPGCTVTWDNYYPSTGCI